MLINIDVAVADDAPSLAALDRLMNAVVDGWSIWEVDGSEPFNDTEWLQDTGRAGAHIRELHVMAVRRSAYPPSPHQRRIRVRLAPVPTNDDELTPDQAARLANTPLTILVENREGDGAFVRRVVAELDSALNAHWQRPHAPYIFDSVGGKGQMQVEVKRRCNADVRPRLVVVVDSDRRGPNENASKEARRLERRCAAHGVPCWVLEKREAENYLPRELLDSRIGGGDLAYGRRVAAWAQLSDDQKDFFDMKEGLKEDPGPAEAALFSGLTKQARALLASGFGSNVDECWSNWRVAARRGLAARSRGDLEHGLKLIRQET